MNMYRKLLSNSVVFAIGNLGSKVITFLMVPLYTRYLTTSQYGQSDVLQTLVSLLTPILTLSVIDAVFRFAMDNKTPHGKVLSNGVFVSVVSILLFLLLLPIIGKIHYGVYICILTYFSAVESMFQEFARGIGKSMIFAVTGIIMTLATVISNLILIVWLGWALDGYLLSLVVAQVVGLVFLFFALKSWQYLHLRYLNIYFIRRMLIYCMPLIPNTISWWLSNSANKYFITLILGMSANGIYAVANKVPSLVSVFYSIFTQAWQISAVEEFENKQAAVFFSKVFQFSTGVLIIGVAGVTLLAQPLVALLSTPAYYSAWQVVPWLALAVLFSSVSAFLGTVYTASMHTGELFTTTVIGAVVNVVSNIVLIPIFGLIGAGLGAALSFLVVALIRLKDSRRFIILTLKWRGVLSSLGIILVETFSLYWLPGNLGKVTAAVCTLAVLVINRNVMFQVLHQVHGVKQR